MPAQKHLKFVEHLGLVDIKDLLKPSAPSWGCVHHVSRAIVIEDHVIDLRGVSDCTIGISNL